MDRTKILTLTREKHLDHMVNVVPFIVLCYLVQCFVILKITPTSFSSITLTVLGGFIALMIAAFITYDLKQSAVFDEEKITLSFLHLKKEIPFADILSIEIKEPSETFSTIVIMTFEKKYRLFFVDDAAKIKEWIESKKQPSLNIAA